MRFIFPLLLILLSIGSFILYTNPTYKDIKAIRAEVSSYNEALANGKELQKERDALSAKYRTFSPEAVNRLSVLLPDSADNIRLIIDIQRMAQSYGMSISAIKFDANQGPNEKNAFATLSPQDLTTSLKDYGVFRLEFSTQATYENFIKFLKDLETSLRLTDVESIDFNAGTTPQAGVYTFTVKIKTYWLK